MGRKTADHNSSCTVIVFNEALRAMWPNNLGSLLHAVISTFDVQMQ